MDYSNPGPQTEYNGRRYTVELTFFLDVEATEDQVSEWLEYELGGGSIACDHPLNETNLDHVSVTDIRADNLWLFTDWGEQSEDGRRSGRSRFERTPPTISGEPS